MAPAALQQATMRPMAPAPLISPEAMGPEFEAHGHQMPIALRVPDVDEARAKLEAAQTVSPEAAGDGYRALLAWRQLVPEVDLYVSPCVAIEWPPEDAYEPEVRLPLSSFMRWVNLLGWSALAIGNLQLIAPADETVLAAGLGRVSDEAEVVAELARPHLEEPAVAERPVVLHLRDPRG